MSRRSQRGRHVAVLVLVALLIVPSAAHAAPTDDPAPVTELVFGPVETTVTHEVGKGLPGEPAEATDTCTTLEAHVTAHLWDGKRIAYRYHHEVRWCWDGETILDVKEDHDWPSHVDSAFFWRGTSDSSDAYYPWGGDDHGRYRSYKQGYFENCVLKYGCIASYFPWITLNVYADGSHTTDGEAD